MLRRQFIEALATLGIAASFGDISLAIVSSLVVAPDKYIEQAKETIRACWELLSYGNFNTVERVLNVNVTKLGQLATASGPYQSIAANLATQANIMLAVITGHRLDYTAREYHCVEAVRFGALSGNRHLHATVLDWHQCEGKVYTYLADLLTNREYAKKAYEILDNTDSRKAMGQSYRSGLLTKKADAARALGDMGECVTCLTNRLSIGAEIDSLKRISEVHDVLRCVPDEWQKETAIQWLKKDVSQALIVVLR